MTKPIQKTKSSSHIPKSSLQLSSTDPSSDQLFAFTSFTLPHSQTTVQALLDGGCQLNILSPSFSAKHNLVPQRFRQSQTVQTIDGSPIKGGNITASIVLPLSIDTHYEKTLFHVGDVAHDSVLGTPWFRKHNAQIDWHSNAVKFPSAFCEEHCISRDPRASTDSTVPTPHERSLPRPSGPLRFVLHR